MFCNKKNNCFCGGSRYTHYILQERVSKGQKIVLEKIEKKDSKLPPYREYKLGALLDAGIQLQALNPTILGDVSVPDSVALNVLNNIDNQNNNK